MDILLNKVSPQPIGSKIEIDIDCKEIVDYKVIIGSLGVWNIIKDYDEMGKGTWIPNTSGDYIIMVQGKKINSNKPFDLLAKEEFKIIAKEEESKLIKDIVIEKNEFIEGEKVNIKAISEEENLLFRFSKKVGEDWEVIKDYSTEKSLSYCLYNVGKEEVLVEAKRIDSLSNVEDFKTIIFNVKEKGKVEITNFECLTESLILDNELVFKVDANYDNSRPLLFKFVKIDEDGKSTCIQDFSSRRIVSYGETVSGKYKLLCYVRDIFSNKEFDDRAIMVYEVFPYEKIKIKEFTTDVKSPQITGTDINFKLNVVGGKELVYRYIIEGPIADDSCYMRNSQYIWTPEKEGEYKITVYIKDASFKGDYEEKKTIIFNVDKKSTKPVRILDVIADEKEDFLIKKPINIKVIAEGGTSLYYSFTIYKNGNEVGTIPFEEKNWIDFIPEEKGEYEIVIEVRDKYSEEEYDVKMSYYIKARDYIPAHIEHLLFQHKNIYLVGDNIEIEALTKQTKDIIINYVTKINNHIVEETGFITNKKLRFLPKVSGKYTFEIYAKHLKCESEFDEKKEFSIYVNEATPVTDTSITIDYEEGIEVGKEITFKVKSNGGKDVCYEFYIMENGNWIKAQNYSKKKYYTFIPFTKGYYRLLVLAKSYYKRVNYEDYCEIEFDT